MNPNVADQRVHGSLVHGIDEVVTPAVGEIADGDARALQRLRADIISHDTVPSAPTVLFEVFGLIDEDGDLRRLYAAIERDGGLTAKVLRTANSTFFGQARTVGTVERAVVVLGVAMVRSIAVSVAVFEAVGGKLPAAEVERIWRHSLATAITARLLAARVGIGNPDEAFTAGLLHDTGRMLLARRFPDFYRALPQNGQKSDVLVEVAERAALGVDHATAGAWLFEAWQLPRSIVEAVAQHHAVSSAQGLPAVVAAANVIAHHPNASVLIGDTNDPHGAAARAAAAACNLTPESWSDLAAGISGDAARDRSARG